MGSIQPIAGVVALVNTPCNPAARERVSDELEKRVRFTVAVRGVRLQPDLLFAGCARVTYDRAIILC